MGNHCDPQSVLAVDTESPETYGERVTTPHCSCPGCIPCRCFPETSSYQRMIPFSQNFGPKPWGWNVLCSGGRMHPYWCEPQLILLTLLRFGDRRWQHFMGSAMAAPHVILG